MARVILAPSADADIEGIIAYLGNRAGYGVAVKYSAAFERLYDTLAAFPDSGAPRPKLGANIRIGFVPPYIVIYRYIEVENTVRVLRIVRGSRRITGKLLRGT